MYVKVHSLYIIMFTSTGCMIAVSQMKVVLIWLQLWDQTPHTWENWFCRRII